MGLGGGAPSRLVGLERIQPRASTATPGLRVQRDAMPRGPCAGWAPPTEVREVPKPPREVRRNQATARQRMDELQGIFTSRHSETCEALRARLASLDEEVARLRAQILSLERELQEVSAERMSREMFKNASAEAQAGTPQAEAPGESGAEEVRVELEPEVMERRRSVRVSELGDCTGSAAEEEAAPAVAVPLVEQEHRRADFASKEAPECELRRESASHLYTQEVLSPILTRRRAEARFREASIVHESSIAHMKSEIMEVDRRMHKQQLWMKQVDEQILQAEITKARYDIRLQNAECRVRSLGQDLSEAYAHTTALLEERLSVEDIAARNDALIAYLNVISRADMDNAVHFTENRSELVALLESFRKRSRCRAHFAELAEQVQYRRQLAEDVLTHTADLEGIVAQLQTMWTKLPGPVKESVFHRASRGATMHPATAIQTLHAALDSISEGQRRHCQMLATAIPVLPQAGDH